MVMFYMCNSKITKRTESCKSDSVLIFLLLKKFYRTLIIKFLILFVFLECRVSSKFFVFFATPNYVNFLIRQDMV